MGEIPIPERFVPFFGTQARILAYGTYRGTDRRNRNDEPQAPSAALVFDNAKINGVTYRGRVDLHRNGPEADKPWRAHVYSHLDRLDRKEPTWNARDAALREAERLAADLERTDPSFFLVAGELYAIRTQQHREQTAAEEMAAHADEHLSNAERLRLEAEALERRASLPMNPPISSGV